MSIAIKLKEIPVEEARLQTAIELLGGREVVKKPVRTQLETHQLLEEGLPAKAAINLAKLVPEIADPEIIPKALGMSRRTLQRYQENPTARLSLDQSGHVWQFAQILALAIDVLGSRDEAFRWLREPAYGLNQNRPIELLSTPAGVAMVRTLLKRIDYGVYT